MMDDDLKKSIEMALHGVSAFGTFAAVVVAWIVHSHQRSTDLRFVPRLTIWVQPALRSFEYPNALKLTFINDRMTPLLIKEVVALDDQDRKLALGPEMYLHDSPPNTELINDLNFQPFVPVNFEMSMMKLPTSRFRLRFMFYDGSFKFVKIDSSNYGPYLVNTAEN
ncbi:MAG: hypothetical protein U1E10_03640 [Bdellovibrionales bacterium]|nr:hypothetical protein [Bdellovibrionales bacterium]